ncbi:hypothetical protein [Turicibacter sanguinis]|uniref:hypothetical protein n=1 Tax=Turicibacter sanguinis TaxID=154288 RepID=UPI0006C0F006|nr:hypothetical protein [Turicibacter sanguinis]CUN11220.1 Uncharacterised protein [Turicibacter sanguinis]
MNYFTFNHQNSLKDYELYFESLPLLPLSSLSEVNNPQINCTLGFKTDADKILKIRKWLSINEGKLKFSWDERCFIVTNIIATEVSKNKTFTVINIIFEVEKYCPIETRQICFTRHFNQIKLSNLGYFTALPLMTIEGGGNIEIMINGVVHCVIENVNGVVTVDSEIQECYEGFPGSASGLKNRDFYGEFPIFNLGVNEIAISSTTDSLTKVTIVPRWVL